jgi:predicted NUDIX family phosphoesterase
MNDRFCVNNLQLKECYLLTGQRTKPNAEPMFKWIEENGFWMPKEKAENSVEFRHVSSYAVLFNSRNQILAYKRKNSESRLTDLWSIGVGGHLSKKDTDGISIDFIGGNVIREIFEETDIDKFLKNDQLTLFSSIKFHSFIISDKTPVDAAHVGHAWLCRVPDETKMIAEYSEWGWYEPEQIEALELETWSRIMIDRLMAKSKIKKIFDWHAGR